MSCKHLKVEGNTTKYYYCNAKSKAIGDYECKDCLLKLEVKNSNELFDFLKGFMK